MIIYSCLDFASCFLRCLILLLCCWYWFCIDLMVCLFVRSGCLFERGCLLVIERFVCVVGLLGYLFACLVCLLCLSLLVVMLLFGFDFDWFYLSVL